MLETAPALETRCLSSLSKVFADEELQDASNNTGSALWNEVYSFQVAYRSAQLIKSLRVTVESELNPYLTIRSVGLSPSELPVFSNPDQGYIRTTPGLYPDPLYPATEGIHAVPHQWRSVWITVSLPPMSELTTTKGGQSSSFPIHISFHDEHDLHLGQEVFTLEVIPAELPDQTLLHTEWFHCDCIATQYQVEVFSEAHWTLIEKYVQNAVNHGVNMLLTPLFTPPLDTRIGGERPTVQLIDVEVVEDQSYRFGFARLERWIDMCSRSGIKYFEFSHLFTQWGAKHAPKIVATVDGDRKQIFGWDTEAAGEAYSLFLDQFLPELVQLIKKHHLENQVFFHVSDEPMMEHLDNYRHAREILQRHLAEFPFLDALSDYEFYQNGLVDIPIPANDHIEPFIVHGVEPLWTYYCCGQHNQVSNRFFSLPSSRNRVLGAQLFKYNVQGFLHWGFNFWYSQYSIKALDPFKVTDADYAFPSGDAFVVYPGKNGPLDSIRWEVFREGLQDLRALKLLEAFHGRDKTIALLEENLQNELTFACFPDDITWLLNVRDRVNQAIKEACLSRNDQQ